jgi:hypothetical protein
MYLRIASSLVLATAGAIAYAASAFPGGPYTLGDMTLTFADHGKAELKDNTEVVLNATWAADGSKVTLTDLSGSYACKAPNATGVYAWKADAGSITFSKDKDDCSARVEALDGKTWKRKR